MSSDSNEADGRNFTTENKLLATISILTNTVKTLVHNIRELKEEVSELKSISIVIEWFMRLKREALWMK